MSQLQDLDKGTLIIVLVLASQLLVKLGEILFSILKKKSETSEKALLENTDAVKQLSASLTKLDEKVSVIPKLQRDVNRSFIGLKYIADDEWPEVAKHIQAEEQING